MPNTTAVILTSTESGSGAITIAGLTLVERTALAAHRAGVDHVHIVGERFPEDRIVERLRSRGLRVTRCRESASPLRTPPASDILIVVEGDILFEPRAVTALLDRARLAPGEAAVAIDSGSDGMEAGPVLAALTAGAVESVRAAGSMREAIRRLEGIGRVQSVRLSPHFCERVPHERDRANLESAYIRHLNGGESESYFTKKVRRCSIPLTRRLVRLGITANQVTLAGIALSLAAGISLAAGGYWAGVLGAILYYASTVLDCSDGEVARATYRESSLGCWLETVADYASYVFLWTGITLAITRQNGPWMAPIAVVALVATLLIFALAGFLRQRVAGSNPGQFDDAWATTLATEGPVYRFSAWARQFLKRSTVAHLLLALSIVGQPQVLLFLWAFGTTTALVLGLAISPFLIRRVKVPALRPVPALERRREA